MAITDFQLRDIGNLINQRLSTEIRTLTVRASARRISSRRIKQRPSGERGALDAPEVDTCHGMMDTSTKPKSDGKLAITGDVRLSVSGDFRLRVSSVTRSNPLFQEGQEDNEKSEVSKGIPRGKSPQSTLEEEGEACEGPIISNPEKSKNEYTKVGEEEEENVEKTTLAPRAEGSSAAAVSVTTSTVGFIKLSKLESDEHDESPSDALDEQERLLEHALAGVGADSHTLMDKELAEDKYSDGLLGSTDTDDDLLREDALENRTAPASGRFMVMDGLLSRETSTDSITPSRVDRMSSADSICSGLVYETVVEEDEKITPAAGKEINLTAEERNTRILSEDHDIHDESPSDSVDGNMTEKSTGNTTPAVARTGSAELNAHKYAPNASAKHNQPQPSAVPVHTHVHTSDANNSSRSPMAPSLPNISVTPTAAANAAGAGVKHSKIYMALNPTPLAAESIDNERRTLSAARVGVRSYAEAGMTLLLDNPDAGDSEDSDDDEADVLAAAETDAAMASAFARARAFKGLQSEDPTAEIEPEPEQQEEEDFDVNDLPDFGELQAQLVKNRTEREIQHLHRQAELRKLYEERQRAEQERIQIELSRIAELRRQEYVALQTAKERHVEDANRRLEALQFQFAWTSSNC